LEQLIQRFFDVLTSALRLASDLPWGMHAAVGLLMAAGLVLWLAGERVLRPAVVVFAGVLGALLGAVLVSTTPLSSVAGVWHGLGIGLFIGLLAGVLMYRSALALGTGVVLGLLLPLCAACTLAALNPQVKSALLHPDPDAAFTLTPSAAPDETVAVPDDTLSAVLTRLGASLGSGAPTADLDAAGLLASAAIRPPKVTTDADRVDGASIPEDLRPALERVQAFVSSALGQARDVYLALPPSHRVIIALAAVIGLAGGVIMGLNLPAWAVGVVSSLFGAALWAPALVWLSIAMTAPWAAALDRPALHWLIVWASLGLIGVLVQWSGVLGGKKAKRPAPAPAPKPA
jgi:hypothetical protein